MLSTRVTSLFLLFCHIVLQIEHNVVSPSNLKEREKQFSARLEVSLLLDLHLCSPIAYTTTVANATTIKHEAVFHRGSGAHVSHFGGNVHKVSFLQ